MVTTCYVQPYFRFAYISRRPSIYQLQTTIRPPEVTSILRETKTCYQSKFGRDNLSLGKPSEKQSLPRKSMANKSKIVCCYDGTTQNTFSRVLWTLCLFFDHPSCPRSSWTLHITRFIYSREIFVQMPIDNIPAIEISDISNSVLITGFQFSRTTWSWYFLVFVSHLTSF